eukprot:CAMPEP_0202871926 /NCGR_PEP_ID=MMETSP1391-20130828/20025_1 /ASSEMBLY_ACC=CAM_ASM_000867 /TAXON_ID=1034604 /ORGANISM="Chlamydomonas leiostraca, Strain SAG 11-49" /LENGTH=562 /DNA_ID=CAMNT_0049552851 /DNA_START=119 /DNA_END=1807 /DNA_ORIENTATION=-
MKQTMQRQASAAGRIAASKPHVSLGLNLRQSGTSPQLVVAKVAAPPAEPAVRDTRTTPVEVQFDKNQTVREGDYEAELVKAQSNKKDTAQASIASALPRADPSKAYDAAVVGAGPAGMFLACELAKRGLKTVVIGLDMPLVNNYGVWLDEYRALGLEHTLECSWDNAVCYFGEGKAKRLGRGYGRVSRRKLREHLLRICKDANVEYLPAEVSGLEVSGDGMQTKLTTADGVQFTARLVTVASGAAGGRFLRYDQDAPSVAAQTAYGIEAEVEGYEGAYPMNEMLFMDFRRHHTGVWEESAGKIQPGAHPNSGDGVWGTAGEVPSFIYAMHLGGNRVFLEETCLVAKPALPFAVLKRRLERRLASMGIKVKEVHEEEWSYIPVGGPLPTGDQPVAAFGAAANLIHPATGFSISRSFREAPGVADELVAAVRGGKGVKEAAAAVWQKLWPQEKRTQTAFHVFGMELLATLDLPSTNEFFDTFFRLPAPYWRGYMASQLDSGKLILFALQTFVIASPGIKWKLMAHLFTDPAGQYLVNAYKKRYLPEEETGETAAQGTDTNSSSS